MNSVKLSLKKSLVISFVLVVFLSNFLLTFLTIGVISQDVQSIYQSMLENSATTARYIFYAHKSKLETATNNEQLVDLIKGITGVDVTIFQGSERVATTIQYKDKRAIGTYADSKIAEQVLHHGKIYQGWTEILGRKYLTHYEPIIDSKNQVIGMLFVGIEANIFNKLLANLQETILVWACISAALAALIGYILTLRIIKPIQELCLVIQQVAAGDFSRQVDLYSADRDVANLLESFSDMLSSFRSIVNQITGKKAELEILAVTDDLTKLYNYRYFQRRLAEELEEAAKNCYQVSLVMIDIDYFKQFNDTYGHPQGDRVLRSVAQIIKNTLRESDVVVRYGGEEFAIVLSRTSKYESLEIAERIRMNIENHPFILEREIPAVTLTISLGLATYPQDAVDKDKLIASADYALYEAKNQGRNKVQDFSNFQIQDSLDSGNKNGYNN